MNGVQEKGRDALWARVQAQLDAGGDPLDDDALVDALAGDPELLAEVVRLCDDLAALRETAVRPVRRAAARILPWLAAAAAAAAAAIALLIFPADSPQTPGPQVRPTPGRVIAFRAVTVETLPDGQIEHRVELAPDGRMVSRRTTTYTWQPAEPPPTDRPAVLSFHTEVTEVTEE